MVGARLSLLNVVIALLIGLESQLLLKLFCTGRLSIGAGQDIVLLLVLVIGVALLGRGRI
jgi:hypothetical protein